MATPTIHITRDADTGIATATVIFLSDGTTGTIASTAPNYKAIIDAITIDGADEAEVKALLRPTLTIGKSLRALSPRIRYDEGNIYFDNDPIDSSLARHIVRIIEEGGDENAYKALVNFMEKLYTNPSKKSIDSLYEFLLRQNITILADGDFLAYKGLNADGTSIHAGYGIVNGTAINNGHLQNTLGAIIEIPRSKVDADTSVGCSTGLHAGSYKYASDFARGLLITVKINPRDVVSVPDDCNFQKIRTSRYEVMAETKVEYTRTTWTDAEDDETDDYRCVNCGDDDCDLDENGECENCREDEDEATVRFAHQPIKQDEPEVKATADDEFTQHITDKPTAEDFASQLTKEWDDDAEFVLNFDYIHTNGETKAVEGFRPEELAVKNEGLLITGKNTEDEWRSYYYARMENLTVRHAGTEGRHVA